MSRAFAGLLLAGAVALTAGSAFAQSKPYKVPRTAHGAPDLQGIWTNATITPFERPSQFGDRLVLTAEEAGAMENENAAHTERGNQPTDPKATIKDLPVDCGRGFTGTNCGYNTGWTDAGTLVLTINGEKRSSIVTTPNGKIPAYTPAAQKRLADRAAARRGIGQFDHPEVRSLGERCLMSFGSSAGPPMINLLYNNNYQIIQTKDEVAILVEMVHDVRTVRIGAKHGPQAIKSWMGDSVGRWDGDSLVIETTNLRNPYRGGSESMKVTERLTRVGPNEIVYKFTIDDPTTWATPWGGESKFTATEGPIYEYACHEGNHALEGILAGARQEEEAAKAKGAAQ